MKRKNQENNASSKAPRNNSNKNDVHEIEKSPEERYSYKLNYFTIGFFHCSKAL